MGDGNGLSFKTTVLGDTPVTTAVPLPVTGVAGSAVMGKVGIDQTTPGTTNRVLAGGSKTRVSVEKTRPADTTAYAAKDVYAESTSVATVWTFTGVARLTGGSGYIIKALVATDQAACVETFKLHLFNAAPTALQDNAACTAPLYASMSSYVGSILFPALTTEGTGATAAYANAVPGTSATVNLPMGFVTAADANLYGIVETVLGFTPASGQKLTIVLVSDVD